MLYIISFFDTILTSKIPDKAQYNTYVIKLFFLYHSKHK